MKTLRKLHLYLGCFFAPMLLFFAISGIWQTLLLHIPPSIAPSKEEFELMHEGKLSWEQLQSKQAKQSIIPPSVRNKLALLSSIHEGRGDKKNGEGFASNPMRYFAIAMSVSLILTILIGIIMAFKFGSRRGALLTLLIGFATPIGIILIYSSK